MKNEIEQHVASSMMQPETEQSKWQEINMKRCLSFVRRLERSIAKAVEAGNLKKARKLQRALAKSHAAKVIAVKKVTQDNRGKNTAGVDGVKSVKPEGRIG